MIFINLREGRTGNRECTFALVIALCMSGLFVFDSLDAYERGNSTYLSIPIACITAFLIFALCIFAIKKSNATDLNSLAEYAIGKIPGKIVCIHIAGMLLISVSELLNRFINLMFSYFFQDASYYSIGIYFLLVIALITCMGFETINRTAKVAGVVFAAAQILLLANSFSSYELYKIYPIAGDGVHSMLNFAFDSGALFLPAFTCALAAAKGMNGVRNASKNGARAMIIALIICGVTQLLLALALPYDGLSRLYMPLYRLSMVTEEENFIVRLDKVSAFVWVAAALLTSCLYMYGASLLYCRSFKQKDIRPCALTFSLIAVMLCLFSHSEVFSSLAELRFINKYGTLLFTVPLVGISAAALIKSMIRSGKQKKREAVQ